MKDDIDIASRPWRHSLCAEMGVSSRAVIVSETCSPGKIIACNEAWAQLCGFTPDEAIGSTPKILQGKETSLKKARQYATEVLSNAFFSEGHGFASRQAAARAKLVNYTKHGRPFVHCLRTWRVRDEDTGEEYFVTESHEEDDEAIEQAMLHHKAPAVTGHEVRDSAIYLVGVAALLLPAVWPVVEAVGSLVW